MEKSEHLALCKHCKNRNLNLSHNISCNFYGDIPDFDTQCEKYEFSAEVKANMDKIIQRNIRKKQSTFFIFLLSLFVLIGTIFSGSFWVFLSLIGLVLLIFVVLDISEDEKNE